MVPIGGKQRWPPGDPCRRCADCAWGRRPRRSSANVAPDFPSGLAPQPLPAPSTSFRDIDGAGRSLWQDLPAAGQLLLGANIENPLPTLSVYRHSTYVYLASVLLLTACGGGESKEDILAQTWDCWAQGETGVFEQSMLMMFPTAVDIDDARAQFIYVSSVAPIEELKASPRRSLRSLAF